MCVGLILNRFSVAGRESDETAGVIFDPGWLPSHLGKFQNTLIPGVASTTVRPLLCDMGSICL